MSRQRSYSGIACVFLIVLLAAGCAGRPEKVQLQLRLQEGQSFDTRLKMVYESGHDAGGAFMVQKAQIDCTYDVLDVSEAGTATVKCTYRSIEWGQVVGATGGELPEPQLSHPWGRTAEAPLEEGLTIVFARAGTITQLKGLDKVLGSFLRRWEVVTNLEEAFELDLGEVLGKYFGDSALGEELTGLPVVYPEHPVSIGDSWTRQVPCPGIAPTLQTSTWTLKERRHGIALLHLQTVVEPAPGRPIFQVGRFTLGCALSGTQEGSLEVDEATGWLCRAELKQCFTGTVKLGEAGGRVLLEDEGFLELSFFLRGTVTIESLEVQPRAEARGGAASRVPHQ